MNIVICNAIRDRKILEFYYHGYHRVVEPYAYGLNKKLEEVLRCYQIGGISGSRIIPCWQFLKVDEIEFLTVTEKSFLGNIPEYKRGDKYMSTIFCEL